MTKYAITVEGHPATIDLVVSAGQFTAAIDAGEEFGKGSASGTVDGTTLSGKAILDGHTVNLNATFSPTSISGTLSLFFIRKSFSGSAV